MNGRTNTTSVTEVIEGVQIPLEPVTSFALAPDTGKIALTWTDPVDKVATPGGEMVAEWNYTLIIRREDRAPVSPSDGIQVLREGTRNQYSSTPYMDEGLDVGKTYYYAAYAYSTIGVVSEGVTSSASPREAILKKNTSVKFSASSMDNYYPYRAHSSSGPINNYVACMCGVGVASTSSHVIMAGSNADAVYCFTKDFTMSKGTSMTQYKEPVAGSLDGYAFFAGGNYASGDDPASGSLDVYSPELTRSSVSDALLGNQLMASASVSDKILFSGGYGGTTPYSSDVCAYTTSLTRSTVSQLQEGVQCGTGTTNGTHAIFAGGEYYHDMYNRYSSDKVTAYDSALTKINAVDISKSMNVYMASCYLNTRALFAGGQTEASNRHYVSAEVVSYDQSLTRQVLTNLSQAKSCVGAATIGGRALFVGGVIDGAGNGPEDFFTNAVDVYDASFTKSSGPALTSSEYSSYRYEFSRLYYNSAGVLDNVAMFMAPLATVRDDGELWSGIVSYVVE